MNDFAPVEGRRVKLTTLGCKLNQYDTEMILTQLRAEGYQETVRAQEADLIVINTCAVTETAERKGRAAIRAAFRSNPRAKIVATGCQAEKSPQALLTQGASMVIGNREKERFSSLIVGTESVVAGGIRDRVDWRDGTIVSGLRGRVRAFLKVQDGCSQYCTYCIVPKLRGSGRSLPARAAVRRAAELVDQGFQEIVLTGVALGTYGFDFGQEDALCGLLLELSKVRGLERLRLSSVEPWAVSNRFLEIVGFSEVICPHLHLPFQSGSNEILRRMNRRYSVDDIRKSLDFAFSLREDWGIGADIIVGFPGETTSHFNETLSLVKDTRIAYLHVFPFSSRPGTPATKLGAPVSSDEIMERANVLRELSRTSRTEFHNRLVGTEVEVIPENRGSQNYVFGHARNYADVALPRGLAETGKIARFIVERADSEFVYCRKHPKNYEAA